MQKKDELIESLINLTGAINDLVESNARMMMLLAESSLDDEQPPARYMDGTPVHGGCKCQ